MAKVATPVVIDVDEQKDVPVVIQNPEALAPSTATKGQGTTLPPTTTEAEDIASESRRRSEDTASESKQKAQDAVFEGQRNINLIWETTQSRIALMVVMSGVILNSLVVILVVFFNKEVSVTQLSLVSICLQFLNLTVGIVIGFYFSRVNHENRGGVGVQPSQAAYSGR